MTSRLAFVAVLAATAFATAVPAEAQGRGRGRGSSESSRDDDDNRGMRMQGMSRLLAGITLTDAQKTRVRDIHLKYQPRMQALRDTARANVMAGISNDSTTRLKVQQVALAERNEIRAVLTVEQQKTFDANVAKFEARRKEMKDRGRKGDRGDKGDRKPF